jgi:hypothetical protein
MTSRTSARATSTTRTGRPPPTVTGRDARGGWGCVAGSALDDASARTFSHGWGGPGGPVRSDAGPDAEPDAEPDAADPAGPASSGRGEGVGGLLMVGNRRRERGGRVGRRVGTVRGPP